MLYGPELQLGILTTPNGYRTSPRHLALEIALFGLTKSLAIRLARPSVSV